MTFEPRISSVPTAYVLPSGLKLVCVNSLTRAEYFGVAVDAGSRDEEHGEFGLAHFVEHTIFKGTAHRRACHIINRMESVGGELNAFTSKEETYVYTLFPNGNLARAAELLADLCIHSVFPAAELNKEREVVKDEIDSYLDTPSESVYDDFEDCFFSGSQLGHNILGTPESVTRLDSGMCRNWLSRNYTAKRMTLFYLGPETPQRVLRMAEKHFSGIEPGPDPQRVMPVPVAPFELRREAPSHQANTIIGARIGGVYAPDIYATRLLINILGGPCMNSRLNLALRERRGLVYAVEASATAFSDTGLFTVYFGCDPEDNGRCLDLVRRELHKIATEPLTDRALEAAKTQFLGQTAIGSENIEQSAMSAARAMMYYGKITPRDEIERRIRAVTADDILRVAQLVTPDKCSSLTLG